MVRGGEKVRASMMQWLLMEPEQAAWKREERARDDVIVEAVEASDESPCARDCWWSEWTCARHVSTRPGIPIDTVE